MGKFVKGHTTNVGRKRNFSPEVKKRISDAVTEANRKRVVTIESRRKMSESRKGERNWNYQGGVTEINYKIRHSFEYRLWREAVFERDKYTCVWCGDNKGGNLNADHIKPFALYPELRFAIDNGRTLCVPCHKTTDTYGNQFRDAKGKFIKINK